MSNPRREHTTTQRRPGRSANRGIPFDPVLAGIFAAAFVVSVGWQGVVEAYRDGQWVAGTAIVVVLVVALVGGTVALERRQRRQRRDR